MLLGRRMRWRLVVVAFAVVLAACTAAPSPSSEFPSTTSAVTLRTETSSTTSAVPTTTLSAGDLCASVIDVEMSRQGDTWTFALTVLSDDVGATEYADQWELRTSAGDVIATRVLAHAHINEQPFTRSLSGVEIPPGTTTLIGVARHGVGGYCGDVFQIVLP